MSTSIALESKTGRRLGRSILAMLAAVVANAALSLGTDQVLHMLGVYPPWGLPMYATGLNALALSYRLVYGVLGGVIVARLAPYAPIRHAVILGIIGTVVAGFGAVVAVNHDLGPAWYPIALAVSSLPTGMLGAAWYERRRRARR